MWSCPLPEQPAWGDSHLCSPLALYIFSDGITAANPSAHIDRKKGNDIAVSYMKLFLRIKSGYGWEGTLVVHGPVPSGKSGYSGLHPQPHAKMSLRMDS